MGRRMLERCAAAVGGWRHVVLGRTVRQYSRAAAVSLAAVDEDGDLIDILVQSRRDRRGAARFFRKLLKHQGSVPRRLITDKLRSYAAARRAVMPSVVHVTDQYANNRAEVSHQPTRQRERQMRRFKSAASRCTASPPSTASYRICSGWADICCGRLTTGCCEGRRSGCGMR